MQSLCRAACNASACAVGDDIVIDSGSTMPFVRQSSFFAHATDCQKLLFGFCIDHAR